MSQFLFYTQLSAQGDYPPALHNLGIYYHFHKHDPETALSYFLRAAQLGYPASENNLGVMYALGLGVPKDVIQALRFTILASFHDHPLAPSNLKILYSMETR